MSNTCRARTSPADQQSGASNLPAKTPFRPSTAMVLAAGLGKRMRPITATMPKPLVEVAGRSLIDHVLDRIEETGIGEVVVNVHYLADLLEVHIGKRRTPKITISDERDLLLDTGGGIARALPQLGDDPFLIANTDSLWIEGPRGNLARMIDAWDDSKMDGLLLLASTVSSIGYDGRGDFQADGQGRISRRTEGRIAPFVYTGAAILHPRLFDGAPDGPFSLNMLFDKAIE
ncbi:MAG: nucleotidyltransferase family protein, partial [Hyphomicrobiales bacterium]|nr:nucleotidyltransferase family protein [Hyphomicrobiales bacterium]